MTEEDPKEKKRRLPPLQVTPDASLPELADWMERLFDQEFPAKLHLVELHGKSGVLVRGESLDHHYFTDPKYPNKEIEKPKKEFFVSLSNRFLSTAQREVDVRRRSQNYGVEAFNTLKSAEMYARFPLSLNPKAAYLQKATGAFQAEDSDIEGLDGFGTDVLLKRFYQAVVVDTKQQTQMVYSAMGQTFQLYQEEIRSLREQMEKFMGRWIEATEAKERALSMAADREVAREEKLMHTRAFADAAHVVMGMVPQVVNHFAGKKILEQTTNSTRLVIEGFLNGSSPEQLLAALGSWDDGKITTCGIFTAAQSIVIKDIYDGTRGEDALDILIVGEHAITQGQIDKAREIFTVSQLMPLHQLLTSRMEKLNKAQKE